MTLPNLPVIVGFGGINAAGRSSFHHSYRRMIVDKLDSSDTQDMFLGLASMMGYLRYEDGKYLDKDNIECPPQNVQERFGSEILNNTLIRKISSNLFDPDKTNWNSKIKTQNLDDESTIIKVRKRDLPGELPHNWEIKNLEGDSRSVEVHIKGKFEFLIESSKKCLAQSAGQLPAGFNPGNYYKSNYQPRGLTLAVFGASDAINSLGIDWELVKNSVSPDQIGVYSGSAMGQLDDFGCKGYLSAFAQGKRISPKQLPLGFAEMPADFINAYVAGNVGFTSSNIGACATFLYNLNLAVNDIKSGARRVAIVGSSEAPIVPEIIEGYRVMGALADDEKLMALDRELGLATPDYRRSCRPFGNNCGFILGEAAQYIVLFDDSLTVELGAQVFGSVGGCFINADGYKKSIASPGFGNYISLARTVASTSAILGNNCISKRSYIHSHGSGTPQNRVTESHIINEIAKTFDIHNWPVAAVKSFVGHSLGPSSGDQIISALGVWKYGFVPGIPTIDGVADDVHKSNLLFSKDHIELGVENVDVAFVNAKGFGGNNASGSIISPEKTLRMLKKKHGERVMKKHSEFNESVVEKAGKYDSDVVKGNFVTRYKFGENVLTENDLDISKDEMNIPGYDKKIDLKFENPYEDMNILDE